MPGGFPIGLEIANTQEVGFVSASSRGTLVAPSTSTANSFGSWTQLTSAVTYDSCWMDVQLGDTSLSNANAIALDIGVGAGGSENVVAQLYRCTSTNLNVGPTHLSFPLAIAAGDRIAARAQGSAANIGNIDVTLRLWDGAQTQQEGAAGVDRIGYSATTTLGTAVTPSTLANTKGSYAQLTASTTRDYAGFVISFDTQNTATGQTATLFCDIAIGASGSEKIILNDYSMDYQSGDKQIVPFGTAYFPIAIPNGSRVAARCQCNTAASSTVSNETIGVVLMGVYV